MVDMSKGMGTSGDVEWTTPGWLIGLLMTEYGQFDLDPCGNINSAATQICKNAFLYSTNRREDGRYTYTDGLTEPWHGNVFVNPPYGRGVENWLAKGFNECKAGNARQAVYLLAARSDTEWWHDWAFKADEICYLRGRVAFEHAEKKQSSPAFPSVLLVYRAGKRTSMGPRVTSLNVRSAKFKEMMQR